jgi:hypothetical protein
MKVINDSYAVNWSAARLAKNEKYCYSYGYVITPLGLIGVYSQWPDSGNPGSDSFTTFEVVRDGRAYTKRVMRTYTDRGLVRVAGQFAREVLG